ncbi:coproporphyrinogen-III oxidase family protein [Deinococcus altitudinis]|uniref:coproporphyrinogen-III oxidase family protein n=1 Tax=Deinococcus altitudinis TaxID=468914 RepID=UPI003891FC5B
MSSAQPAVPPHPPAIRSPVTIRHAYIHVPFCPSICPYCDFHVLERRGDLVERYLARIEQEAEALAGRYDLALDTLYLGGGTPSFLRPSEMETLVASLRRHIGWGRLENTLEVNPGTVSPERAAHWRGLGFDRASVGVQSLDDPTLKFLGRQHTAQAAREAVQQLTSAGFRVSGDLITAVAGQPLESDIAGLIALGVEHVSAYTLTIEPGTPFARQGVTVREEDEERGFEQTEALLTAAGFDRYEVSNYARSPDAQSRHNRAYWTGEYFLGLGPGGAGSYPGNPETGEQPFRRTNPHLHQWLAGEHGDAEPLSPEDVVTDALFMGLRLREGLHLPTAAYRSGLDVQAHYAPVIAGHLRLGLLELDGEHLRATRKGWWLLNRVVTAFLEHDEENAEAQNRARDRAGE